jgi:hypothetical protein
MMKILICLLMISLSITSSCIQTKTKEALIQKQQNPREINTLINGRRVYINDSSLYSQRFVRELQHSIHGTCDSLILINDTLFVYSTTTYKEKISHNRYKKTIPGEITIGKPAIYTAEINGEKYSLTLLRTNLTEVKFDLNIDGHKTKSGIVILGGTFYFGAECGFTDENGKEYCSAQYLSDNYSVKSVNDSRVRITIQYGSGEHVSYDEYFTNENKQDIKAILKRQ